MSKDTEQEHQHQWVETTALEDVDRTWVCTECGVAEKWSRATGRTTRIDPHPYDHQVVNGL